MSEGRRERQREMQRRREPAKVGGSKAAEEGKEAESKMVLTSRLHAAGRVCSTLLLGAARLTRTVSY